MNSSLVRVEERRYSEVAPVGSLLAEQAVDMPRSMKAEDACKYWG